MSTSIRNLAGGGTGHFLSPFCELELGDSSWAIVKDADDEAEDTGDFSGKAFGVLGGDPIEVCVRIGHSQITPDAMLIRVWLRTAIRKDVTSFGTFLSTVCHEFCHHLDFKKFGLTDSWHTRGFYERAALYHHARGTPLRKLFWVPMAGGRWRINWQRMNRGA